MGRGGGGGCVGGAGVAGGDVVDGDVVGEDVVGEDVGEVGVGGVCLVLWFGQRHTPIFSSFFDRLEHFVCLCVCFVQRGYTHVRGVALPWSCFLQVLHFSFFMLVGVEFLSSLSLLLVAGLLGVSLTTCSAQCEPAVPSAGLLLPTDVLGGVLPEWSWHTHLCGRLCFGSPLQASWMWEVAGHPGVVQEKCL